MEALVNVAFPIFAIMGLGYLAGARRILGPESTQALNRYVFLFALPAALFVFAARAEFAEIVNLPFMAAYSLGSLATVILALIAARLVFRLDGRETAFHGYLSIFANSGYMGIPLFLTAFGAQGILPAIIGNLIGPILAIAVIMAVLEVLSAPAAGIAASLTRIAGMFLRNPVLLASVGGILFSMFAIPLPAPLTNLLNLLGSSAGPTALFALGLSLVGHPLLGNLAEICWLTLLKLVVHPLLIFLSALYLFPVDPYWAQSAVLLAAMPVGSTAFVVSQQYGVAPRRTSAAVALSTAASIVTLTALLAWYGVA